MQAAELVSTAEGPDTGPLGQLTVEQMGGNVLGVRCLLCVVVSIDTGCGTRPGNAAGNGRQVTCRQA